MIELVRTPESEFGFWPYARENPELIAVVDPRGDETTFGALHISCNRLSNGLRAAGVARGSVVAVAMPNCTEWLTTALATMQIGAYLLPVNWNLTDGELEYLLADSGAVALITHADISSVAARLLAFSRRTNCGVLISVGQVPGFITFKDLTLDQSASPPDSRCAGAFLSYTSGTTGRPKGVVRELTDGPPEEFHLSALRWRRDILKVPLGVGNVHLCCSPLYNAGSLSWAFLALQLGHKVVLAPVWHSRVILGLIEKHNVTITCMVPAHFVQLLKLPESTRKGFDLSRLKHVIHGSAPCPVEIKRRMIEWLGPVFYETYSSTEFGMTLATSAQWLKYPGTVGIAGPGHRVKILDESSRELPCDTPGYVYMKIRPGSDFRYKGDAEKTSSRRVGDYATVGDIGYLNEEGFLFLCDRDSETMIVNGVNIYPAEIEGAMVGHPLVADCVATAAPNEDTGEEVRVFVQVVPGTAADDAVRAELLQHLQRRVARFKCPREIQLIDRVPRDESGKLFRRKVREHLWKSVKVKI